MGLARNEPESLGLYLMFGKRIVEGERPLCLLCDFEWRDLRSGPPSELFVVGVHGDPEPSMVSGICEKCAEKENLLGRCVENMKRIWPDLRAALMVDAPDTVQ
jgi:hypothetical protein